MACSSKSKVGIEILKIVNPGSYWVKLNESISLSKISSCLEEDLRKFQETLLSPNSEEYVCVKNQDSLYYRGVIKCSYIKNEQRMCHVFLVDSANELDVPESKLYNLKDIWKDLRPLAFFVGIHGILPPKWDFENVETSCKSILKWDDSTGGLEQLVSQATSISFESICYIDKDLYGNILLEVNDTLIDLKDYILRKNLATSSYCFETDLLSYKYSRLQCGKNGVRSNQHCIVSNSRNSNEKDIENSPEFLNVSDEKIKLIKAITRGLFVGNTFDTEVDTMNSHRSYLEETSEQAKNIRREPFSRGVKEGVEGTDSERYTPASQPIDSLRDLSSGGMSENKDTDSSIDFDESFKPVKPALFGFGRGKPPQELSLPKISYSNNSQNMYWFNERGSPMDISEPSPRRPKKVCPMPASKRLSLTNKSKLNSLDSEGNKESLKDEKTLLDNESLLEPKSVVGFGRGKLTISPSRNTVEINTNSSLLTRSGLMEPEDFRKNKLENANVLYNMEDNIKIKNPQTKDNTPEEKSKKVYSIFGRGKLVVSLNCGNEKEVSVKASVVHKEPIKMSSQQLTSSNSGKGLSLQQYVERIYIKDNTQEIESVEQADASYEESITMEQFSDCIANAPLCVEMSRHSSSESLECVEEGEGESSSSVKEPSLSDQDDPFNSNTIKFTKEADSLTSEEKNDSFTLNSVTSDCTVGKMVERLKYSGAMLHGDINIQPISSFYDLKLHPFVAENLIKKGLKDLTRCQIYAVPVMVQKRSLVLIGPPKTGKSISYVISIISLLMDPTYYSGLRVGNGPKCVFVLSCAQSVRLVAKLCSAVGAARLTVIPTYGGGLELERKDELTNGCDVLITTPRCWLRLLQHPMVTNINRLCHLVFDEIDILFKLFKPEMKQIIEIVRRLSHVRKSGRCEIGIQTVLVGENWFREVEELCMGFLERPVLCMTSFVEAALYANIKPVVTLLQPQAKLNKLRELIEENKKLKSIIVCDNADEVKQLRNECSSRHRSNVLYAHEEMPPALLTGVLSSWSSCPDFDSPILLCTDETLSTLGITNAEWLCHYSLPLSKSNYNDRFSSIKDNFQDRISNPKVTTPRCKVNILVDESNECQFPELVSFMERLSIIIPSNLKSIVERILLQREKQKHKMPLCENILQFGICRKESKCKDQHIINLLRDTPINIPVSGFIKLKILHVIDASHYSVRILEHSESADPSENIWKKLPSSYAVIGLKMAAYFSNRDNRKPHGRAKPGDMVAVEVETDSLFRRATVLEITARDDKCNPTMLKVLFVDDGIRNEYKDIDLLALPPDLQEYPWEALDVYLANLLPVDLDPNWSYASTFTIKKCLTSPKFQLNPQYFFVGRIGLTLGRNIVLDRLQCCEFLEMTDCNVVHLSVRHKILEADLAVHNPQHLPNLKKLCSDAGFIAPQLSTQGIRHSSDLDEDNREEVQWAHLDQDDFTCVNMIAAENPSLFFLKVTAFHEKLLALQKDLEFHITLNGKRSLRLNQIAPGFICAALSLQEPKCWNRAMVVEILDGEVDVFYVDHGDFAVLPLSSLVQIPKVFISRLPFQAIECELIGVKSLDDEWLTEATETMYNLTQTVSSCWKNLFVKVCGLELKAKVTGGRHYKVVLIDTSDNTDKVLNKELMYLGFANWDGPNKHFLNHVYELSKNSSSSPMSSDEEEEEILNKEDKEILISSMSNSEVQFTEVKTGDEFIHLLETGDFDFEFKTEECEQLFPKSANYLAQTCSQELNALSEKIGLKVLMESPQQLAIKESPHQKVSRKKCNNTNIKNGREVGVRKLSESDEISDEECEEGVGEDWEPQLITPGVLQPQLLWHQDCKYVFIKVNLSNVIDYYLRWTASYVYFSTRLGEKHYRLHIDFFGPINPETLEHHCRGLYLDIKVEKIVKGHDWPRIFYEKKRVAWAKPNPDFVKKEVEDESLIETFYNLGIKSCESSELELSSVERSVAPENLSGDESDNHSDIMEFSDAPYDPFDPFS